MPSGSGLPRLPPPSPNRERVAGNTRSVGSRVEARARRHYRLRAYRILGENVWIGGYELDLVVRRGTMVVFCEVKSKFGEGYGDPLEMVTPEKMRRVRRAASAWLAAHPDHARCTVRFDVVAERSGKLERVAAAF